MIKYTQLLIATLIGVLFLVTPALAREVYPNKEINEIIALSTDGNRAQVRVKRTEPEYVIVGDKLGKDRLVVVEIDARIVLLKNEYDNAFVRLPVGGGVGF